MDPKITAVITTYNRCSIVPEAIRSVAEQTRPLHELIVIDDGSNDDTREAVLNSFKGIPFPCRYIYKNNAGMATSLNRGIQESTGDWVAFLDDDDLWHRDHIERCVNIASRFTELGCICGLRDEGGETQTVLPTLLTTYEPSELDSALVIKKKGRLISPFFTPVVGTSMIRNKIFDDIQFDVEAGARLDIHFFWRLSEKTSIGLELRSHGVGRQFRTSLLSTDKGAPQELKDDIELRRNMDEIRMLRLLLSQIKPEQAAIFRKIYRKSLVGRSWLLRNMGRYSDGLHWLRSCWRECDKNLVMREAILCGLKLRSKSISS
ncbi:glycosyltransferase family A protein [Propionivibrio sp.]|uniref:glycosyltransferase family A protein n=1 Tax=Propionivibrio sp. TaxID=2212460 RepID=UPI003BF36356